MRGSLPTLGVAVVIAAAISACAHGERRFSTLARGDAAIDTVHDYEVGRVMLYSGLGQYERMHRVAPESPTGLLLLTRGWSQAGWWFVEDDWEVATDLGDDEVAEDARTRARGAYTRAVFYGLELLEHKAQDFDHVRTNPEQLRSWLHTFDGSDAETLLWTGWAWLGRSAMSPDIPAISDGAQVGVALIKRAIELDEGVHHGLAHAALGSWYARSATAPSLESSRRHFERALQLGQRKYLSTQVLYARSWYCLRNDEQGYVRLLQEVLDADDPLPEQRLANVAAQRRARRYLTDVRMADCGL